MFARCGKAVIIDVPLTLVISNLSVFFKPSGIKSMCVAVQLDLAASVVLDMNCCRLLSPDYHLSLV